MTARRFGGGQRGGAAVEFAFVFPFLFFLMYGVLVYSYLFVLQESINFAAQEAAEAAVKVDETGANADSLRVRFARETAAQVLSWLPADQRARVLGNGNERVAVTFGSAPDPQTDTVIVQLNFEVSGLFPVITLYFVGEVPPMPNRLTARAVARV